LEEAITDVYDGFMDPIHVAKQNGENVYSTFLFRGLFVGSQAIDNTSTVFLSLSLSVCSQQNNKKKESCFSFSNYFSARTLPN